MFGALLGWEGSVFSPEHDSQLEWTWESPTFKNADARLQKF